MLRTSLAAVLILSGSLWAQPSPPLPKAPTISTRTELVVVPAVVMRDGKHVTGLKSSDFVIEEDGHKKQIAFFEEYTGQSKPISKIKLPPGIYTNEIGTEGPQTVMVFALDLINTPDIYQTVIRDKLMKFLQSDFVADRPVMLAVLHPNGLHVIHDFTTDPMLLAEMMRSLKPHHQHDPADDNSVQHAFDVGVGQIPDVTAEYAELQRLFEGRETAFEIYNDAVEDDRKKATLEELIELAQTLAPIKGMKSLVWLSGGFTFRTSISPQATRMDALYRQALQQLSASTVTVYPIDTTIEGGENPTVTPASSRIARATVITGGMQRIQNFWDIAKKTGGDYCLMNARSDQCFTRAADYSSHYYLLSYYSKPGPTTTWRTIQVKVKPKHESVHAREGYFSLGTSEDKSEMRLSQLRAAVTSQLEFRAVPMSLRWTPCTTSQSMTAAPVGSRRACFALSISPGALASDGADHHLKFEIIAAGLRVNTAPKDLGVKVVEIRPTEKDLKLMLDQGLVVTNTIDIPEQVSLVRFLVRDDIGEQMGTLTVPVEVSRQAPPLPLSDSPGK